ncbi:hypothetical protein [Parabacteroides goldsteinii]|uniref:hypothetical protein n=1 Tax=Parabacteroides goldsteinii TaxID=328812 RepID=UPI00321C084A
MEEFYEELRKLMPLKNWSDLISEEREKQDFREGLSCALDAYVSLLKEYKENLGPDIDDIITKVEEYNNYLKECVNYYFDGRYNAAYNCINTLLSDDFYEEGYSEIPKETVFYRARNPFNPTDPLKEMFHIPLNKRGIVKTERYSAPGYPCLYLGTSINACWEELGQPCFGDMKISRFVVKEKFPVLDLRMPSKNDLIGNDVDIILKKLPLILASSICVQERDGFFKPEYIIPQLIIEYIITKNRDKYDNTDYSLFDFILGVYYTSTHINDELKFPHRTFNNLALPAVLVEKKETYCQLLASCFEWTKPTSYSYEDIRCKFGPVFQNMDEDRNLTEEELNYKYSKMGELEERMSTFKTNKIPYLVISRKKDVVPGCEGEKALEIRSSGDYKIEILYPE